MLFDVSDPTVKVLVTNSPANGPLINGYIEAEQNQMYSVKVELMATDLGSSSEYADIIIGGISFGRCDPSLEMTCDWYTCTEQQFMTTGTSVSVQIQYSSEVNDLGDCTSDGLSGHGVARITLTP